MNLIQYPEFIQTVENISQRPWRYEITKEQKLQNRSRMLVGEELVSGTV